MKKNLKWFDELLKKYKYDNDFIYYGYLVTVAEIIYLTMKRKKINIKKLSKKTGYKKSTIKKILRCEYNITLKEIVVISNVLKIKNFFYLMNGDNKI